MIIIRAVEMLENSLSFQTIYSHRKTEEDVEKTMMMMVTGVNFCCTGNQYVSCIFLQQKLLHVVSIF